MYRQKLKQGFSIEELKAGNESSTSEDEEEEEEAVSDDDNKELMEVENNTQEPDFYDGTLDDKNELWVQNKFEWKEEKSKIILCCPGCFTPICYQAKLNNKNIYEANRIVNSSINQNNVVNCAICGTEIGKRINQKSYTFIDSMLPSTTGDQL